MDALATGKQRRQRRWIAAVLAALAGAVFAPSADAVEIYPSWSPAVLRGDGPWHVTYRIELDAGPMDETVWFDASGRGNVPFFDLDGPAMVGPGLLGSAERYTPCPGGGGITSAGGGYNETQLTLPAGSSTLITSHATITKPFMIGEDRFTGYQFSLEDTAGVRHVLDLSGPELAVRRQVPLSLRVRAPRSPAATGPRGLQSAAAGTRVPISGQTSPLLAGQLIDLRIGPRETSTSMPELNRLTRLARVRVQPDGSFSYRDWRPAAGLYVVRAYYVSHDRRFLDTTLSDCAPAIEVQARA